jgi:transcriptional regulator
MFIPRADAARSDAECWDFLAAQRFGQLIAPGRGREFPVVVPTQYAVDDGVIVLHLARPNPVWSTLAEHPVAVLSVAGDWAYIPGRWKAIGAEDPGAGIPTTYYAAVQAFCDVEIVDGPELLDVLRTQLAVVEPSLPDPAQHASQLAAIRGLVLRPRELRGKFKYGGNVDSAHRTAVAARLVERNGPGDAAALSQLLRRSEGTVVRSE